MLPSRSTHLPIDVRSGAKTPGRENSIHTTVGKANINAKNNGTMPLPPNTQARGLKDRGAAAKLLVREVTRPLVDKTPFPNREAFASNKLKTPLPDNSKLAKLLLEANRTNALFLDSTDVPDSVARASSGRTHVRAPRLSANNKFKTPLNNGRHWDVNEAELSASEVLEEKPGVAESSDGDYDEIEYMPPKSVKTYRPPFDFSLPNYSSVGKTLLTMAQSYPHNDTPPAELEPTVDSGTWEMFILPEIETDDPFLQGAATRDIVAHKSAPKPSRAAPSSRSRPGTSNSRALSNSRPATSTASTGIRALSSHVHPGPVSATNTTVASGSKMARAREGPNVGRPATAAAIYPLNHTSAYTSRRAAPLHGRNGFKEAHAGGSGGELRMFKLTSPEIEDDFIFNV
ncbi:hypothetical protein DFH09DRAFT_1187205, partial [Mycena vulgaris]